MNDYPELIKKKLTSIIKEMSAIPELFVKRPGKDFSRNRKLSFEPIIQLLLSMGGNSIYAELLEYSGYDINTVTTSAFIQQRNKILPFAFEFLLHEFINSFQGTRLYHGYRMLAIDGSDLNIATNSKDMDTYSQYAHDIKGFNLLHLNAMYDLCNKLYVDAFIQSGRKENEHKALTEMIDRSDITDKVIIIADRGYESYNNFAHIEKKGWDYVIRVKDITSNGILAALQLPDKEEFDVRIHRILTRKQTMEIKAHPDIYWFMPQNSNTCYIYQVNFTVAIQICRYFFRCCNNAVSPNVEALIRKNILPVREGRKDQCTNNHNIDYDYIHQGGKKL